MATATAATKTRPAPGRAPEADIQELRAGVRAVLGSTCDKALEGGWAPPECASATREACVLALEKAVYNRAVREYKASPRLPHRRYYADIFRAVNLALPRQVGPYPDDVLALRYLAGAASAEEVVTACLAPAPEPDPRETIRRMFVRTLMDAHDAYACDPPRAPETARAIEISCYNAAVRASKESEEPPRRQWDSPAFVDIYSTRCGTINELLDRTSCACVAYGPTLVPRLVLGDLDAGALGDMTAAELCPQATAAERAEIAKRSEQRVEEKESNLFRCPHCGARSSTYREVQRRSLDEAPDYLCRCLKCKHRFTGRG